MLSPLASHLTSWFRRGESGAAWPNVTATNTTTTTFHTKSLIVRRGVANTWSRNELCANMETGALSEKLDLVVFLWPDRGQNRAVSWTVMRPFLPEWKFAVAVFKRQLIRIFLLFDVVHAKDSSEVDMRGRTFLLTAAVLAGCSMAHAAEIDEALAVIKAIKREGAGNAVAAARWKELVKAGPPAIPTILAAFEGADATVVNWFRSAVDAIAENESKAGRKLDAGALEAFVKQTKYDPRARLLAFELLERGDRGARTRILPALVNDPGAGIRREAIEQAMKTAEVLSDNSNEKIRAAFGKLFVAARDVDQVEAIAKKLKDLGAAEPDVISHLGIITHWEIAGPFDNTGLKAFGAPLPKVESWKEHATGHTRGMVDLYTATGKAKGVKDKKKDPVYALCRTVIESPTERTAQVRVGSENAVKIFFNGQEMFGREEYHHGHRLDQCIARVTLKKGPNEIMLKVLQDDLTFDWTVDWHFQCRVCDEIGGAVPMTVITAPKAIPISPRPEPKEEKK